MSPRGDLGRLYKDGEIVIREGEVGDSLFVIQSAALNAELAFREPPAD